MHEFDLGDEIPDDATTIEIYAIVKPAKGWVEVRRSPADDEAIILSAGSRTTIGVPEGRKLYVWPSPFTEKFNVFVAGWFTDRDEQ